MKRVLVLFLAACISACNQAPEFPVQDLPPSKATPVQNAPKTSPIPIQPLTSVPAMPNPAPLPTPISTPVETGTAATTPADSPTFPQSDLPASSGTDSPPPSASGS